MSMAAPSTTPMLPRKWMIYPDNDTQSCQMKRRQAQNKSCARPLTQKALGDGFNTLMRTSNSSFLQPFGIMPRTRFQPFCHRNLDIRYQRRTHTYTHTHTHTHTRVGDGTLATYLFHNLCLAFKILNRTVREHHVLHLGWCCRRQYQHPNDDRPKHVTGPHSLTMAAQQGR